MAQEVEDERQTELSAISAIFPEMLLSAHDPFTALLDLPVNPSAPLPVVFLKPSDGAHQTAPAVAGQVTGLETHLISHLPYLHLEIVLPTGYPAQLPPIFKLSTTPPWLPRVVLDRLELEGDRLWNELGRDQTVFAYIDRLQQDSEDAFGLLSGKEYLEMPQDQKVSLLDFNINAERAIFERGSFDCGICLDPKRGSVCHRMVDCGHVFCRVCLQDFYNNAIAEGDLVSVKCLEPACAKARSKPENTHTGKRRKRRTNISPSELLQIPLEQEVVKRYVYLKRKAELESDKNTVYCPRKWCQGAARSGTHTKPSRDLEDWEESEEDEPVAEEALNTPKNAVDIVTDDCLCICEDCSFAFCSRCYLGWHGALNICGPRRNAAELREEDRASIEYMKLHSTPCPTCAAPAQKTHGCNHMICFRCQTHFCYLCAAWLDPGNPYNHYNLETIGCYMRLWELEAGDGDDVGIGFAGGVQAQQAANRVEEEILAQQANELAIDDA